MLSAAPRFVAVLLGTDADLRHLLAGDMDGNCLVMRFMHPHSRTSGWTTRVPQSRAMGSARRPLTSARILR